MLTRTLAVFGALAVIGFAVAVAPRPAAAQSGGDSSTAAATATATPAPMATSTVATSTVASFGVKPRIEGLNPRGLTRLGNKWYVGGWGQCFIYIFSDAGTYERRIKTSGALGCSMRGLSTDGTRLLAISSGGPTPSVYKWTPQSDDAAEATSLSVRQLVPPRGNYRGQGIAYDGTHVWAALQLRGSGSSEPGVLIKLSASLSQVAVYKVSAAVDSLTYENGYLYGLLDSNGNLARIRTSDLSTTATTAWKVVRRAVELRDGLAFRNGVAYGISPADDEVRKARQPSPERLFALTPHIGNLNPRGLTRLGNKWYVGGWGQCFIYIFSDSGTYERRIKTSGALGCSMRGLSTDGTRLLAISSGGPTPSVYKWTPQSDDAAEATSLSVRQLVPPRGNYRGQGIAYDGTHVWAALQLRGSGSSEPGVLIKLSASLSQVAVYKVSAAVDSLTYENGYLYGLLDSNGNLARIRTSDLSTTATTAWKVVRRAVELRDGLAFRNGVAYGISPADDEVRKARRPSPERLFALTPRIGDLNPRGLTRLGNKWYVGGWKGQYVYIFSDTGTYERRIRAEGGLSSGIYMNGVIRGLATNGAKLVAVTNQPPRVYAWTPQTNDTAQPVASIISLTTPPGGGQYHAEGIAHDGTNLWVAASWPFDGANKRSNHGLLKLNDTGIDAIYRTNRHVNSLARENGYLYALSGDVRVADPDLLRIKVGAGSTLRPYTSAALLGVGDPPVNDWEIVRRSVEIRTGLAFRNGTAYGFNAAYDEVRAERRTTPTTPTAPTTPTTPATSASPASPAS